VRPRIAKGVPQWSTVHPRTGKLRKARLQNTAPELSQQELARVCAVIQIDEALTICDGGPREVAIWFRTRNTVAYLSSFHVSRIRCAQVV